jgi:hypothetical protein
MAWIEVGLFIILPVVAVLIGFIIMTVIDKFDDIKNR